MRLLTRIAGLLLLILGAFLWFLSIFFTIGINDAEWGKISKNGSPSKPELFIWTAWQKNDGSIYSFSREQKLEVTDFRVGQAHTSLFTFTAYEGRNIRADHFPALGPHWGASYNYTWTICALLLGTFLLFLPFPRTKDTNTAQQDAAANP